MGIDGTDLQNGDPTSAGKRKSKKVFSDGSISWDNAEDKFEGSRIKFLEDIKLHKIKSEKYSKDLVKKLPGHEVTVAHMQREGFNNPIFVQEKDGLGRIIFHHSLEFPRLLGIPHWNLITRNYNLVRIQNCMSFTHI